MNEQDKAIETLRKNETTLAKLSDQQLIMVALGELMHEMALGKDVPIGIKYKRIALGATLMSRAGVKL